MIFRLIVDLLKNTLLQFEKNMGSFVSKEDFSWPETRTSAPVTIPGDHETLISQSHSGLYPCGEGAGYAGGITSAVDGVKVAMSIIQIVKTLNKNSVLWHNVYLIVASKLKSKT